MKALKTLILFLLLLALLGACAWGADPADSEGVTEQESSAVQTPVTATPASTSSPAVSRTQSTVTGGTEAWFDGAEFLLRLLWDGLPRGDSEVYLDIKDDNGDTKAVYFPVDKSWKHRSPDSIRTAWAQYCTPELIERFTAKPNMTAFPVEHALKHHFDPADFPQKTGYFMPPASAKLKAVTASTWSLT
ncbi:MAG: hypothetical protein LBT21_04585 [Oscillospiraceae bacterium]|jgi:hypothetical protein|nr:hypothetical protein [Oscillospiraceae bacterium]